MKIFGTDFDGAIINIESQKAAAFGNLVDEKWQLDLNNEETVRFWLDAGGTSRRHKFNYLYQKKFNNILSDKEYKVIENEFSNLLQTKYYPKVKLLPGALDLLKFTRANFDSTFVSSGVPMDELRQLMNTLKLSEYFDLVLGTDDKYASKQDHFRKIIADKIPDISVFVADGLKDMEIAGEFNFNTIGVTTNHSREELEKAGASVICNSALEVTPLLKSWLSH